MNLTPVFNFFITMFETFIEILNRPFFSLYGYNITFLSCILCMSIVYFIISIFIRSFKQ